MAEKVKNNTAEDRHISSYDASPEQARELEQLDFPEGGTRAWAVALGCAGLLFCTFGFANAFGSVYVDNAV